MSFCDGTSGDDINFGIKCNFFWLPVNMIDLLFKSGSSAPRQSQKSLWKHQADWLHLNHCEKLSIWLVAEMTSNNELEDWKPLLCCCRNQYAQVPLCAATEALETYIKLFHAHPSFIYTQQHALQSWLDLIFSQSPPPPQITFVAWVMKKQLAGWQSLLLATNAECTTMQWWSWFVIKIGDNGV